MKGTIKKIAPPVQIKYYLIQMKPQDAWGAGCM